MSKRDLHAKLSVLLLAAGGCAANRQAAPSALPMPLVSALIEHDRYSTRSSSDYSVGTLPKGYPAALVPAGPTTIVGGMTSGDQIVAVFADSSRHLAGVLEQVFTQAGYSHPAPTPGKGFMSGSGPYSFFCRDSAMVSAQQLTGAERHMARVTFQRAQGRSSCSAVLRKDPLSDVLELPELKAPAGVHVGHSHGGSGGDGVNSSAEVTGMALIPATVLAHYSSQLSAAGWTAASPAISDRVAAQFFEVKTATGVWEGVLMVAGGGTTISVTLAMDRHRVP